MLTRKLTIIILVFSAIAVASTNVVPASAASATPLKTAGSHSLVMSTIWRGAMNVDCKHLPKNAQALRTLKSHNICTGGSRRGHPSSTATGDCGTITLQTGNGGNGDLEWTVTITAWWYLYPIVNVQYSGSFVNNSNSNRGYFGVGPVGTFTYSWVSEGVTYSGAGSVVTVVDEAYDVLLFGAKCYETYPVSSTVQVS